MKPKPRGIAFLGLHTLAARLVIYGSGFVSSVLIARALGASGRGLYVVPITLLTIVVGLTTPGLELAQVRLWSRRTESAREWARSAAWLTIPVGTVSVAVAWIAYELGRSGPFRGISRLELATVVVLILPAVHSLLIRGLLVIDGQLAIANRALVLGDLCRTAGVIALFLADRLTVEAVLVLYAATVLVPWALLWRAIGGFATLGRPAPGLVREQLSTGARLSPYFLFLSLNLRLDVLLLAALANSRQVGVYSVAVLIAELVWMPTWALAQATKEQQAGAEPRAAAEVTARALRMTLVVSVLLAAGLALVAPPMVLLLFGSDFESAIAAIWVLLPASVAMAVWRLLSVLLARLAPIRVTAGIALAAVLSNCLLNLLLIPALGIIGAALASVASYGCGAALALNRFKRIAEVPWRALLPGGADIDDLRAVLRPRALRRRLAELRAATGG